MRKLTLAFLLLMAGLMPLIAQSPPEATHDLSIGVGLNQGYFQDDNFSPLNHGVFGVRGNLGYLRTSADQKHLFRAELDYAHSSLSADGVEYLAPSTTVYGANLKLGYLTQVAAPSDRTKIYAGATFQSDLNMTIFSGLSSFTFLFDHGIDLSARVDHQLADRHHLSSTLDVPVFSLLVRPPYNGFDKTLIENQEHIFRLLTDGSAASFGTYQAADWSTTYRYDLNERVDLTATYQLSYQRATPIYPVTYFQNQLSLGAILTL